MMNRSKENKEILLFSIISILGKIQKDFDGKNISSNVLLAFNELVSLIKEYDKEYSLDDDFRRDYGDIICKNREILSQIEVLLEGQSFKNFVNNNKEENLPYSVYNPDYAVNEGKMVKDKISLNTSSLKCLFIGSGPFPATSMYLSKVYEMYFDLIDKSKYAEEVSIKLIDKVGLSNKIHFLMNSKIEDVEKLLKYDCIWIAIMVGNSKDEKVKIYKHLFDITPPCQKFVIRSVPSDSIKTVFYEPFPFEEFSGDIKVLAEIENESSIVTSYLVEKVE